MRATLPSYLTCLVRLESGVHALICWAVRFVISPEPGVRGKKQATGEALRGGFVIVVARVDSWNRASGEGVRDGGCGECEKEV